MENMTLKVDTIEPDFFLDIGSVQLNQLEELGKEPVILATVGTKQCSKEVSVYYDLHCKKWTLNKSYLTRPCLWLNLFATKPIRAHELIEAVRLLVGIEEQFKRMVMLYIDLEPVEPYFRGRSLCQSLINELIKSHAIMLIKRGGTKEQVKAYKPSHKSFEPYQETAHYVIGEGAILSKRLYELYQKKWNLKEMASEVRSPSDYSYDIFYNQIPMDEKIYLPINLLEGDTGKELLNLKLEIEYLAENYAIVYDTKENIERMGKALSKYVMPNFLMPILRPVPIEDSTMLQPVEDILPGAGPYTGKGVYIGMIMPTGVDYTQDIYLNKEGTSRIAMIWEQEAGSKGVYYTQQDINRALASEDPNSIVPVYPVSDRVDLFARLVGTYAKPNYGLAVDAELVMCQVQPASKALQEIYAGTYYQRAALYPDVLICIGKMLHFARTQQKPIVIYMPYLNNLGPHDGSCIYDVILRLFAKQQGCTVVIPSGEEGNKKHHRTLVRGTTIKRETVLYAKEAGQNLIGVLYARNLTDLEVTLQLNTSDAKPVSLNEVTTVQLNESTIYTNGMQFDFGNGSRKFHFRIKNMPKGNSILRIELSANFCGMCDLWLAQETFNKNVTLQDADAYITLGSPAASAGAITVGNFNTEDLVVSGASGRGYSVAGMITPVFVTQGFVKAPYDVTGHTVIEGTGVATSLVGGLVAILYEKWMIEKGIPYANSYVMRSRLLGIIKQYEGATYPNQNEGYGVLDMSKSKELCWIPFE